MQKDMEKSFTVLVSEASFSRYWQLNIGGRTSGPCSLKSSQLGARKWYACAHTRVYLDTGSHTQLSWPRLFIFTVWTSAVGSTVCVGLCSARASCACVLGVTAPRSAVWALNCAARSFTANIQLLISRERNLGFKNSKGLFDVFLHKDIACSGKFQNFGTSYICIYNTSLQLYCVAAATVFFFLILSGPLIPNIRFKKFSVVTFSRYRAGDFYTCLSKRCSHLIANIWFANVRFGRKLYQIKDNRITIQMYITTFSNRFSSLGEIDGNMREKGIFSTEIEMDYSFNHLGKIEIATMGPVSHFLRWVCTFTKKTSCYWRKSMNKFRR